MKAAIGSALSLPLFSVGCTATKGTQGDGADIVAGVSAMESSPRSSSGADHYTAWEAAGAPGEAHRQLEPLVGKWRGVVKLWWEPTKPPEESPVVIENRWVLDGRFLEEKHTGWIHGRRFHGQGLIGFDNVEKRYVSTWADTMGTGIEKQHGRYDPKTKSFTLFGSYRDPATGELEKTRSVIRITSPDSYSYEMFEVDESGWEYRSLEITATRLE